MPGLRVIADVASAPQARLKPDIIGLGGLTALVIGVTSPAIGLYACWGPIEAAAGPIAPLVFLAALAITLPTALSYASLNHHAPSAAATASWLWRTVGPATGLLAGLVMVTYFTMGAVTVPLLAGLFLRDLLDWLHAPIEPSAAVAIGIVVQSAVVGWICLRGAEASVKTTIRLMVMEAAVVLALSATILWVKAGQPGGVTLAPFDPSQATAGAAGFWAAMILGMLAFSGFDAVATAAEEAKAPRTHVPRALFWGLAIVALFWAANSWVLTLSTPPKTVAAYNAQGLTAITPVASAYWGWGKLVVIATAFTGLTAIYIGCVQGASRVVFALARHGLLPAPLAAVRGERRVPVGAVTLVVAACAVLALVSFALLDDALDAFTWWSGALVFFAAIAFTGVNVANLLYFRRIAPGRFQWLQNLAVPVVGVAANLYLVYAAFFVSLWSAPFRTGRSVVLGCLALLALQIIAVAWMRLRRSDLLRADAPIGVDVGPSPAGAP